MQSTARRRLVIPLAGMMAITAACASDGDDSGPAVTDPPATAAPAVGDPMDGLPVDDDQPPAAEAIPQRIVSLSPTHTEILFAVGAGDQVVAVDEFSDHPPEALQLPNELSGFEPSVEAIAAFEPDLVVIGGDFTGLGDQLAELDIASWDGPAAATLDDTYRQIEELGAVVGHEAEARELVARMEAEIESLVVASPRLDEPLDLYHELDPTYYSADSSTFIGAIYELFGLENIADAAGDAGGFPLLNAEFIVDADPDLIFLADTKCCDVSPESVAARPGWDAIAAVRNGNVIPMDDDIASRWGPRVVDYARAVAAAVEDATATGSG